MYADDTTLTSTISTFSDNTNNIYNDNVETSLNAELLKINEWLQINKLSINVSKSKYMIFQKVDEDVSYLTLNIDNTNIERVYEFKKLGLILDANLNWKKHLGKLSNQCSKKIGILNKLKHTLPQEIKTILYNSLILPHINYCIMAWGFHSNRILKLQKKALRIIIITLSKYNSHSEPLYKKLGFLKVDDIFKLQQLKFDYTYLHDNLPAYLQNWKLTYIHTTPE